MLFFYYYTIIEFTVNDENINSNNTSFFDLINSLSFSVSKFKNKKIEDIKVFFTRRKAQLCTHLVAVLMPFSVGRLYIETNTNKQTKDKVINLVESIKNEFVSLVQSADWMDEHSKKVSVLKVNKINYQIAYPDFIFNDTHLNNLYQNVT